MYSLFNTLPIELIPKVLCLAPLEGLSDFYEYKYLAHITRESSYYWMIKVHLKYKTSLIDDYMRFSYKDWIGFSSALKYRSVATWPSFFLEESNELGMLLTLRARFRIRDELYLTNAVKKNKPSLVRVVLENSYSITEKDYNFAVQESLNNIEVFRLLVRHKEFKLYETSYQDLTKIEMVETLIDVKAPMGNLLISSASKGRIKIVKRLLEEGKYLDYYQSAYDAAVRANRPKTATLIKYNMNTFY